MEFSRLVYIILACLALIGTSAALGFAWKYGALTAIELFSRKFSRKRSTHNGGQEEA